MKLPKTLALITAISLLIISGCNLPAPPSSVSPPSATPPAAATPPSILTPPTAVTPPPISPVTPPGGKLVACNADSDCVPNPSICHPHECVTKTAAAGMTPVEICTMMFDYQAAYSPEDCTCDLGICKDKNLGRTSEVPGPQ